MASVKRLKMGALLPHCKLFGGVKRFFELGAVLSARGNEFIIFSPDGVAPEWYPDPCPVEPLENLQRHQFDALFITEERFLQDLVHSNATLKIFYHVGPRPSLANALKYRDIIIFVNSTNMYEYDRQKYGIDAVKALGGIHIPDIPDIDDSLSRDNVKGSKDFPFIIMAYGRISRKGKGTSLVVKACEKLHRKGYHVRLLLFDSPLDETAREKIKNFSCKVPFEFVIDHPVSRNHLLFRKADVFVAAEKKGGWSNTAAEALASGVALVGTRAGTKDFLIHKSTGLVVFRHPYFIRKALEKLINNPDLRTTLARNGRKKVAEFNWENLGTFIESYVRSRVSSPHIAE